MALEGTPPELEKELREKPDRFAAMLQKPRKGKPAPVPASEYGDLRQIIADIVAEAGGGDVSRQILDEVPELSVDGTTLTQRFEADLPLGLAKEKLLQFPPKCGGEMKSECPKGCTIAMRPRTGFWGKWLGRQPELEIGIRLEHSTRRRRHRSK